MTVHYITLLKFSRINSAVTAVTARCVYSELLASSHQHVTWNSHVFPLWEVSGATICIILQIQHFVKVLTSFTKVPKAATEDITYISFHPLVFNSRWFQLPKSFSFIYLFMNFFLANYNDYTQSLHPHCVAVKKKFKIRGQTRSCFCCVSRAVQDKCFRHQTIFTLLFIN